ncbi:hypothetical protein HDV00_002012, partial [Rhizophlyctis rosea]
MDTVDNDYVLLSSQPLAWTAPMDAITTLDANLVSPTDTSSANSLPPTPVVVVEDHLLPSLLTSTLPSSETLADTGVDAGTMSSLEAQLHQLRKQVATLQAANDALSQENLALKTELVDTKHENTTLKRQLSDLTQSHTAIQSKHSKLTLENISLKSQTLSLTNQNTHLTALLQTTQSQLAKLNDSNASLLDQVKILEMFFYNPHIVMGVVEL